MTSRLESIINADSILFFDLDGTLVDTDYANFLAYKKAIEFVKGANFDISYNSTLRLNRSELKKSFPHLTEIELGLIISKKEKYYSTFLSETKLNNNIAEVLFRYYKTNKTILVTNSRKERAMAILDYHGLVNKFHSFFFREFDNSSDSINKFKNAILGLVVSPLSVIVFENEESEIILAQEIGIYNINP